MRSGWTVLAVCSLLCGCFMVQAGEDEQKIPLSQVPDSVKKVAETALPGVELKKAEIEKWRGEKIFELDGIVDGKKYEFKIKPDGTLVVLKLEADEEKEHHKKKGKGKGKKDDDDDEGKGKKHDDDDD